MDFVAPIFEKPEKLNLNLGRNINHRTHTPFFPSIDKLKPNRKPFVTILKSIKEMIVRNINSMRYAYPCSVSLKQPEKLHNNSSLLRLPAPFLHCCLPVSHFRSRLCVSLNRRNILLRLRRCTFNRGNIAN